MSNKVGIDKIAFYSPDYYIDMVELAHARDTDPNKYTIGLQQDKMSVIPVWEDIVSMGANAALQIIDDKDRESIDQVIFATESSFDYSKSAATYIHNMLGIHSGAKSFEVKQACYAGTAGLMAGFDYVRANQERRVLVVAADIARYGLHTSGEPTQGAGAVAMIISSEPKILSIDAQSFSRTDDQYDFWRPSHSPVALVDGHFSNQLYADSFINVFQQAEEALGTDLNQVKALAFHLPYTKMAKKALTALSDAETKMDEKMRARLIEDWQEQLNAAIVYGKQVGNTYTASLYISLMSLLKESDSLKAGDKIGLFSYGSGSVSELFFGNLVEGYQEQLEKVSGQKDLDERLQISIPDYEKYFGDRDLEYEANIDFEIPTDYVGFYLAKIDEHRRYYDFK